MKQYADKRRHAKEHDFVVGDSLLLDGTPGGRLRNKKILRFSEHPRKVVAINGTMVTVATANGRGLTRQASFFKRCTASGLRQEAAEEEKEQEQEQNAPPLWRT